MHQQFHHSKQQRRVGSSLLLRSQSSPVNTEKHSGQGDRVGRSSPTTKILNWQVSNLHAHQPKIVAHLISSDSSDSGVDNTGKVKSSDCGQNFHQHRSTLSGKFFLPLSQHTNVSHLISSDSDENTESDKLEKSMLTTQEFLIRSSERTEVVNNAQINPDSNSQYGSKSVCNIHQQVSQKYHHDLDEDTHNFDEETTLPLNWHLCYNEDGFPYYYNSVTGESSWELPNGGDCLDLDNVAPTNEGGATTNSQASQGQEFSNSVQMVEHVGPELPAYYDSTFKTDSFSSSGKNDTCQEVDPSVRFVNRDEDSNLLIEKLAAPYPTIAKVLSKYKEIHNLHNIIVERLGCHDIDAALKSSREFLSHFSRKTENSDVKGGSDI